jgi:hypothetical protein
VTPLERMAEEVVGLGWGAGVTMTMMMVGGRDEGGRRGRDRVSSKLHGHKALARPYLAATRR